VKELLSNVGSGGGAPAVGAPAAGAGGAAPAGEAPAEEKKEEEKEESDEDMVRIFSICFYACLVLTMHMLLIGLWSLRLIYVVLTSIIFSLHSPSRCIFPLHITHKIIAPLPRWGVHSRGFR
jgi:60s acidic ribosomal protein L12/P0/P1/P2